MGVNHNLMCEWSFTGGRAKVGDGGWSLDGNRGATGLQALVRKLS